MHDKNKVRFIKLRRLRWIEHVIYKYNNRILKSVLDVQIQVVKRRGLPS